MICDIRRQFSRWQRCHRGFVRFKKRERPLLKVWRLGHLLRVSKQGKSKVNVPRIWANLNVGITSVSRLFCRGAYFVNFCDQKRGCGAFVNLRL